MYVLTKEGKSYVVDGLPEKNLVMFLSDKGNVPLGEAKKSISNFSIALQWALKNRWVSVRDNKIVLLKKPEHFELQEALEKISKGQDIDKKTADVMLSRKLIDREREHIVKRAEKQLGSELTHLTPELIKTGLWRKAKFKEYNVEAVGRKVYPGKMHILSFYIKKIREIFFDLGFEEASGPFVESSFWNFDALFQPQDHPARDMADTFYMKAPKEAKLPDNRLVSAVSAMHEKGGSGSTGWRYKWSPEIARQAVLRTHTTAVSVRKLAEIKPPAKIFCIGRVFRNETLDFKHLPEFTQIEGIVVDENVGFKDLLGYLREFYLRMGFKKIRFRPSYFPYTEMSVEPEVYFKDSWLELGGAGIFRPEVTKPLGIDATVLAWGLSLERPVMLKMALNDIRNFYYRNDLDVLRNAKLW